MGILSKSTARATALAAALFAVSCTSRLPWSDEPIGNEVNLAFTIERNLVELTTARIDNRPGRFILGTAARQTVVDPRFALKPGGPHSMQIGERATLRVTPQFLDLGGVADAIVGSEAWQRHAITINYKSGIVSYQKYGIVPAEMTVYRFDAEPMINVIVNGQQVSAIVDTTSPDTLVLPASAAGRGTARVAIAGTDFGTIDVAYANVSGARIGNRLLSHFLVTIDYGKKWVGVWRDPRIAFSQFTPRADAGSTEPITKHSPSPALVAGAL